MKSLIIVLLALGLSACVSTYGSKDFSTQKLNTLIVGKSTVDDAKNLLGKPERDFRGDAEQVSSYLGTLLSTVLPKDFLESGEEYVLWKYEKRGSVDLLLIDADSNDSGVLLFDAGGTLLKTFDTN